MHFFLIILLNLIFFCVFVLFCYNLKYFYFYLIFFLTRFLLLELVNLC